MENKENKKNHLPLYGIGPALCCSMALITAVCIWLANKGHIPGKIDNKAIKLVFLIIGIALIIEGIVLFFGADLNGNLQENIKANQLKTNGSYKYVRNPCYCMFLFGCRGIADLCEFNFICITIFVLDRNDNCFEKYRGKMADEFIWTGVHRLL